jgi:hypothetical protein
MSSIQQSDLNVLTSYYRDLSDIRADRKFFPVNSKNYPLCHTLLAVNKKSNRLQLIQRDKITCWNLFKRLFNRGELAYLDFSLRSAASYLNKYDWTPYKTQDSTVFKAVCAIANRWARHSFSRNAWNSWGSSLDGDTVLLDKLSEDKSIHGMPFKVNPETEVCDLGNQIRRRANQCNQFIWNELKARALSPRRHARQNIPDEKTRDKIMDATSALNALDKGNDALDRRICPITKAFIEENGKISELNPHDLVSPYLQTIKKICFVSKTLRTAERQQKIIQGTHAAIPNIDTDFIDLTHQKFVPLTEAEETACVRKSAGRAPA